jgi:hypothetical protein
LWFEWVLSFSGWTYAEFAPSESFEALGRSSNQGERAEKIALLQ